MPHPNISCRTNFIIIALSLTACNDVDAPDGDATTTSNNTTTDAAPVDTDETTIGALDTSSDDTTTDALDTGFNDTTGGSSSTGDAADESTTGEPIPDGLLASLEGIRGILVGPDHVYCNTGSPHTAILQVSKHDASIATVIPSPLFNFNRMALSDDWVYAGNASEIYGWPTSGGPSRLITKLPGSGAIAGLATSSSYLFSLRWGHPEDRLYRHDLPDGAAVEVLSGVEIDEIATAGDRLFGSAESGLVEIDPYSGALTPRGPAGASHLHIHDGFIYFAHDQAIWRTPLDGGPLALLVEADQTGDELTGIASDGLHLYWTVREYFDGSVRRTNLEEGGLEIMFENTDPDRPFDIQLDETHAYWRTASGVWRVTK